MNILLAFDSFKGSADAIQITQRLEKRIKNDFPTVNIKSLPIADGGEGSILAIEKFLNCKRVICSVHNALMEKIDAYYVICPDGTAVIEMASASGLPLIDANKRNPLRTTTYGTGEMILNALKGGCRKFILGLGGSATNDAGIGALNALGINFLDKDRNRLEPIGENLNKIEYIDDANIAEELKNSIFTIACDVKNPLYGNNGAAYIFAPQKGATEEDTKILDEGLKHYSNVLYKESGKDIAFIEGSGAAGGMGGGLLPFINAKIESGRDIIMNIINADDAIKNADIIITGEGKIDRQTIMGKALGGILDKAVKYSKPIIVMAGCVEDTELLNHAGFTSIFSIQPYPINLEKAMNKEFTLQNLERCTIQILRLLINTKK